MQLKCFTFLENGKWIKLDRTPRTKPNKMEKMFILGKLPRHIIRSKVISCPFKQRNGLETSLQSFRSKMRLAPKTPAKAGPPPVVSDVEDEKREPICK